MEKIALASEKDKVNLDFFLQSLESTKLTDFVKNMPNNIYTQIGDNGIKLSGGQR